MADILRDEKGHFLPGQVTNPNGRPVGSVSLADSLRRRLTKHPEEVEKINDVLIKLGLNGDMRAIEHSYSYVDGKPIERHQIKVEPIKLVFVPASHLIETAQNPNLGTSKVELIEEGIDATK